MWTRASSPSQDVLRGPSPHVEMLLAVWTTAAESPTTLQFSRSSTRRYSPERLYRQQFLACRLNPFAEHAIALQLALHFLHTVNHG